MMAFLIPLSEQRHHRANPMEYSDEINCYCTSFTEIGFTLMDLTKYPVWEEHIKFVQK
jgi:hypothetical protein